MSKNKSTDCIQLKDLGLIYNNSSFGSRTTNRTIIDQAIMSALAEIGNGKDLNGFTLNFGSHGDTPVNSELWIDVSSGPIKFPNAMGGMYHVGLDAKGVTIIGHRAPTATSPVFELSRNGTENNLTVASARYTIWEMDLISLHGSGIHFNLLGKNVVIHRLIVKSAGKGILNENPEDDFDTSSYGVKFTNIDGIEIGFIYAKECVQHGIIMDRVHIGNGHIVSRENNGRGILARGVRGGEFVWYCEGNDLEGFYLSDSRNVDIKFWLEANGRRIGTISNQAMVRRCTSINFNGMGGCEEYTMCNWDSGSAATCNVNGNPPFGSVVESEIKRYGQPEVSIETLVKLHGPSYIFQTEHNWKAKWANPTFRPTAILNSTNQEILLDIPQDCFGNSNLRVTDMFLPFKTAITTAVKDGDLLIYYIEYITESQDIVDWTNKRFKDGHLAQLLEVQFNIPGAGMTPEQRSSYGLHIRKANTIHHTTGYSYVKNAGSSNAQFLISPHTSGQEVGVPNPAFTLRITKLLVWLVV